MYKLNEKGLVLFILIFVFAAVSIIASFLSYKTFFGYSKKLSNDADVLSVALASEYNNPFDKQYVNPFGQKNPFDDLK